MAEPLGGLREVAWRRSRVRPPRGDGGVMELHLSSRAEPAYHPLSYGVIIGTSPGGVTLAYQLRLSGE